MAKKKEADKGGQNEDSNKGERDDGADDEEPNFSDPEGFVDDIKDEDLLGDLLEQKPKESDGVESIVVVDGVPEVGPDRIDKLRSVINKVFSKVGKIVNDYYPKTETGVTKGFIFIEYSNAASASEAAKLLNGHKLDKNYTFTVNIFTDFKKYENIPLDWEPPQPEPYKERGNLQFYVLEPDSYDQFSIITKGKDDMVQIWQNSLPEPTLLAERKGWTEKYIRWSPLGTFLATIHLKGVAIWGGPGFDQIMKFGHTQVEFIDFSPCEKYLVTYSPLYDLSVEDPSTIIIWDVRSGKKKRGFTAEGPSVWPVFRWSSDDKYFARLGQDMLSVYETPSFGLLEKKSIKIPGVRDFSWSPTDNIIAYWVAEEKDVPARVTLLEIPSRNEVRSNNLFNVADCKMHWQKSGDYLCVKVDRYAKVKKEKNEVDVKYSGMYYNFEIFNMREKLIPVDSVELKESIQAFAWEPVGSKFSIIHGESPNVSVSFYGVKTGQRPMLLKKWEKKQCNHLFWAPCGQIILLAGLHDMNGTLEFVDTNDFTIMAVNEHYMATDVEWDPTGRYVVTGVSFWKHKMDNSYWIHSFQGKTLKKVQLNEFCQLLWRPRPPSLLSREEVREIKKNLKKYSPQFEIKDRMRQSKASKELVEKRVKLMKEFDEYRQKKLEEYANQKQRRLQLRNNMDTDEVVCDPTNLEDEVVEFLVKEEVVVLDK